MNFLVVLQFLAGLLLLIGGAEIMVRGASRLAAAAGVSPLLIGLTVVAYGTSAPELAVSVQSAFKGQAGLALGNVVGSNIFAVLVVLGLAACVAPLAVSQQLIKLDVPLLIGASVLTFGFAFDGQITRLEGAILVVGAIVYTLFLVWQSRRESAAIRAEYAAEFGPQKVPPRSSLALNLAFIVIGLVLLVGGAHWLVESAVSFAKSWGVSDLIIGLTVVAAGTSAPEIATSVIATLRGERDIAVGNVVGSCLSNLLIVLGLCAAISPLPIAVDAAALRFDLPVMIAVSLACLPVFWGGIIARWQGAIFLLCYAAYTVFLILQAQNHAALPVLNRVMLWIVLPLTTLVLVSAAFWGRRQNRSEE